MREILFRGKDADNGEWVYGYYAHFKNMHDVKADIIYTGYADMYMGSILPECYDVNPKTIGQYTGLTDKNGTRIFEGDICWFYGGDYYSGLWEQNAIVAITDMTDDEQTHYLNNAEYCEVIGNIFDNPELLKGSAKNE